MMRLALVLIMFVWNLVVLGVMTRLLYELQIVLVRTELLATNTH